MYVGYKEEYLEPFRDIVLFELDDKYEKVDLISFNQIVRNNDISKKVSFEFSVTNAKLSFSKFKSALKDNGEKIPDGIQTEFKILLEIFENKGIASFNIKLWENNDSYSEDFQHWNPFSFFKSENNIVLSYILEEIGKKDLDDGKMLDLLKKYKFKYSIPEYFYDYVIGSNGVIYNIPSVRKAPPNLFRLVNGRFNYDDYYHLPYNIDKKSRKNLPPQIETFYTNSKDSITLELISFSDILNKELEIMGLAKEINVKKNLELNVGYLEFLTIDGNSRLNVTQGSSGLLQLLPIIGVLLEPFAREVEFTTYLNPFFVIEQPELHLHPKAQLNLMELFNRILRLYENRCKIVIETHSEHLFRKLQLIIAEDFNDLVNKVGIYFFTKNKRTGTSEIRQIEIDNNGFIKTYFPEGFFDEASELALALLEAQLKRNN